MITKVEMKMIMKTIGPLVLMVDPLSPTVPLIQKVLMEKI